MAFVKKGMRLIRKNKRNFLKGLADKPWLLFLLSALLLFIAVFAITWALLFLPPRRMPQEKILKGVASFSFNRKNSLDGWEEKIFKDRVMYSVIEDKTGGYLKAHSKNSASGLVYWLKFNPETNPMVRWKWKVLKFPSRDNDTQEGSWWLEKDDYPARFYVIFPRFPILRYRCIEYVWDKDLPLGTVLTNPYFPNLKIIVVESGENNTGKWVTIERNVFEDFKMLFDANPPEAGAIAIMTDSENTQSEAEAQYNDIEVGYEKQ